MKTLINQEDPSGCGIACVATVTGNPYQYVKSVWVNQCGGDAVRLASETIGVGGLGAGEIIELLSRLGQMDVRVQFDGQEWRITGTDWTISNPKKHWWVHWVVEGSFASAVKCGEQWTPACDKMYEAVFVKAP